MLLHLSPVRPVAWGVPALRRPRLAAPTHVSRSATKGSPAQQANDERDQLMAVGSLAASLAAGAALGVLGPFDEALPQAAQHASAGLGWSYFLAWSISFYPQVYDNWRRKSVTGLSSDYLVYSILGYAAYTAYTAALYFSPGVQAAYMAAHGGSAPDVQLTDFAFASHALLVSLFTLYQCFLYGAPRESPEEQQQQQQQRSSLLSSGLGTSRACELTALGVFAALAAFSGHIGTTCGTSDCHAWLPLLYLLGATKVTMTLIKYTPQALLNHSRRSTDGWQINNVLLDLAGGILSFAQIGLNALARGDVSVVTGNPAKLGISLISIGFDVIFILQHYVLYRTGAASPDAGKAAADAGAEQLAASMLVPVPADVAGSSTGRRLQRRSRVTANATAAAAVSPASGAAGAAQPQPRRRGSSTQ